MSSTAACWSGTSSRSGPDRHRPPCVERAGRWALGFSGREPTCPRTRWTSAVTCRAAERPPSGPTWRSDLEVPAEGHCDGRQAETSARIARSGRLQTFPPSASRQGGPPRSARSGGKPADSLPADASADAAVPAEWTTCLTCGRSAFMPMSGSPLGDHVARAERPGPGAMAVDCRQPMLSGTGNRPLRA